MTREVKGAMAAAGGAERDARPIAEQRASTYEGTAEVFEHTAVIAEVREVQSAVDAGRQGRFRVPSREPEGSDVLF